MPSSPHRTRCQVPGCRNWAMRGHTHCRSHSGQTRAPEGNQSRLILDFYAAAVRPDERDHLEACASDATLAAEIAIARITLRRILRMVVTGETPGDNPSPLDSQDHARYVSLAFQGVGAISLLLRANHALGGGSSAIPEAIESALDALGERWDLEL
jgi:hypothetical protein